MMEKSDEVEGKDLEMRLRGAVFAGEIQEVKDLLSMGADPNIEIKIRIEQMGSSSKTEKKTTLLVNATKMGDYEIAEELLDAGAEIDVFDEDGLTPLMWAAQQIDVKMVELLLRRGANEKLRDLKGEGPLHKVCASMRFKEGEDLEVCKLLISGKESLLEENESQISPLQLAEMRNSTLALFLKNMMHVYEEGSALAETALESEKKRPKRNL